MLLLFAGKYYLVDVGYPNEYGYLGPYKGERYHFQEYRRRGQPSGRKEVFNRAHSSLRNVIERSFGGMETEVENFAKHACLSIQNTS